MFSKYVTQIQFSPHEKKKTHKSLSFSQLQYYCIIPHPWKQDPCSIKDLFWLELSLCPHSLLTSTLSYSLSDFLYKVVSTWTILLNDDLLFEPSNTTFKDKETIVADFSVHWIFLYDAMLEYWWVLGVLGINPFCDYLLWSDVVIHKPIYCLIKFFHNK